MQVRTKAIVLSALKYGDTSLIVRCYTQTSGLKSYLLRGVLKSRKGKIKPAYFQVLSQLELVASHSNKGSLNSLKEARPSYVYTSVHSGMVKQSIAFFLAEMLANTLKEEEGNEPLFLYLETALQWLDVHDSVANFHLGFLINLTKFLGFYPDEMHTAYPYFNMADGQFSQSPGLGSYLSGKDLSLFKSVLGTNFDSLSALPLQANERQRLLEIAIAYCELHLSGFQKPKSIQILKELFD